MIVPVGQWVLEETCRQIAEFQRRGLPEPSIAVNISPRQLHGGSLAASVAGALEKFGVDGRRLELELTESMMMHDTETAVAALAELKRLGVNVTIDDFGTGYSSLAYLKRFAVDHIMIDRSFVRDLTEDPSDAAIISAIVAMAQKLGFKVIAEGAASEAKRELLAQFGCDQYQGYLFSRPVPAEDAIVLWQTRA